MSNLVPNYVLGKIIFRLTFEDIAAASLVSYRFYLICSQVIKERKVIVNTLNTECMYLKRKIKGLKMCEKAITSIGEIKMLNLFKSTLTNVTVVALEKPTSELHDGNIHLITESLPNLQCLSLANNKLIYDNGLSALFENAPNLERLGLHNLFVTGVCFKNIPKVKQLSLTSYSALQLNLTKYSDILCDRVGDCLEEFSLYSTCNYPKRSVEVA
ncbi:hypothetical protein B4U79_17922 [Dinothrombium tinctorium]|uniref:F-box domain-containing protein n=1 Tax=Dinothrombium tinctorium TaxID=1965070 RepID=A0A3S3SGT0_9ACAR|nr:hypothetical protein B4U79_17922 [Dinothrombium tinctorium]